MIQWNIFIIIYGRSKNKALDKNTSNLALLSHGLNFGFSYLAAHGQLAFEWFIYYYKNDLKGFQARGDIARTNTIRAVSNQYLK